MTALLTASEIENRWGRSYRPFLTKIISPDTIKEFGNVAQFDILNIDDLASFDDLVQLIEAFETNPHACLIRGRAKQEGAGQFRRLHDRDDGAATITPDDCQWVMLDIDKLELPDGLESTDEILDLVISMLPEPFHDATCYYQWSAKAFLDGAATQVSCHLFYWLARPISCRNLHDRTIRGDWKGGIIDAAPFTPNQIHYTAAPIFRDGAADPLPRDRSGIHIGMVDEVELDPWTEPFVPRSMRAAYSPAPVSINELVNAIGEDGRIHEHTRRACHEYVRTIAPLLRDRDGFLDRVWDQLAAVHRDASDQRNYNRQYLDRMFDSAVRKLDA